MVLNRTLRKDRGPHVLPAVRVMDEVGLALQENFSCRRVSHLPPHNQGAGLRREKRGDAMGEVDLTGFVPQMKHHLEENDGGVALQWGEGCQGVDGGT